MQMDYCNTVARSVVLWSARPYESCKILKGRPRRNAFSNLVHRAFPIPHRVSLCVIPHQGFRFSVWVAPNLGKSTAKSAWDRQKGGCHSPLPKLRYGKLEELAHRSCKPISALILPLIQVAKKANISPDTACTQVL